MFFMMGITQGRKELPFTQTVICDRCGSYGRYMVFMTYTVLSLFFIPVFRWGKKYYVRIRTYKTVGSTKFYSGWSAAKAVTVKK